jgi:hypothetical protein
LFVPHRDSGRSILLWNDGKGHLPTATNIERQLKPGLTWPRLATSMANGRPDLAIINERLKATLVIFNRSGRQFREPVGLAGPERLPYCLACFLGRPCCLPSTIHHIERN